ncbi:ArsC/Spx/MgsR family protein [Marinospirillum perlucidum]|uniref:ArsC/Spx/MgsR family protein n=1 Tax=Marinospirillum perlucidum TaxID=1982602 RepID=UPI000DF279B8|nr:ArsC/Spx/MgsR family protein [Marinospirillum perlucidum]
MTRVIFYEKPGCINNTRQKQLLAASGHEVIACNLLKEPWTSEGLKAFFQDLPLPAWFNKAAPAIKQGEIKPEELTEDQALALMLKEPLLIRRPLMLAEGERKVGFEVDEVKAWIGLDEPEGNPDLQTCPRSHEASSCKPA